MPKKKNRKHGRNRKRKANERLIDENEKKYDSLTEDHTLVNFNQSDYTTPMKQKLSNLNSFDLETPIDPSEETERLNVELKKSDLFESCTPEIPNKSNKRRSFQKQREGRSDSWNVTNIYYDNVTHDTHYTNSKHKKDISRRRSSSSISQLHLSRNEKPLSFHKSTQTINEDPIYGYSNNLIVETPRLSQRITEDVEVQVSPKLNNARDNSNRIDKIHTTEININPYLKSRDIIQLGIDHHKKLSKEPSIEEPSFFSPQLFKTESSSTPVETHGQKLFSYLKETVIKETIDSVLSSGGKLDFINNRIDTTPLRENTNNTPRSEKIHNKDQKINNSFDLILIDSAHSKRENVNFNTPPLSEKITYKDKSNSIKLFGHNKRQNYGTSMNKLHDRTSPKLNRLLNHSRMFNKNISYTKFSTSRRSDNVSEISKFGIYEKMLNKIRKYSRASAKWSYRMVEVCSQLGIQIKKSLTSLCTINNNSIDHSSQRICKCEQYQDEINNLNTQISNVNGDIECLREQITRIETVQKNETCKTEMATLQAELSQMKQELSSITDLRSELTFLKEQFQCFKSAASSSKPIVVPPPPPIPMCPPPPPPPPPPPMPQSSLISQKAPKLGLLKKSKTTLGISMPDKGDSRPVISLDDILKVKLKKASERPVMTPMRNRTTTPVVSMDMLRQVKLRPAARPTLMKSTPNRSSLSIPGGSSGSSEASTSPLTSLCRLLNGDSTRLKRLKKVGGYSFDSVHRKSPALTGMHVGKRERSGN
ncbi:uncharacterized protein LOC143193364 isoform X2 [Rhynchophorus ferrugineus]